MCASRANAAFQRRYTIAGVAPVPRAAVLALAALLVAAGLASAACSRHTGSERAPTACAGGVASDREAAIRSALAKAPGPVALPDGTRLSDCLAHPVDGGDLETIGSTMLRVTQQLADAAAGGGDPAALTQLGYLIGAMYRGAARAGGANDELVRRLDQELQDVDVNSPAYLAGERAGRSTG